MISDRLDFLMKVTNTRNSALGRALSFDPSYISRIRSGKRGLPKNHAFIAPAAAYFARRIEKNYQKSTAAAMLCPGRDWPDDAAKAEKLIFSWLSHEELSTEEIVGSFIKDVTLASTARLAVPEEKNAVKDIKPDDSAELFYGNSGRREAVKSFLEELAADGAACTLRLSSDENMTWFTEDAGFLAYVKKMLGILIAAGCRIKMVHEIGRDISDMTEAVRQWIPLYLTGAIEPCYYPKLRDGLYKRTMFIAEGHSAILSGSVLDSAESTMTLLMRGARAADTLTKEFDILLSACRPLMSIFRAENEDEFVRSMTDFENGTSSWMLAQCAPSVYTMPARTARSIAERYDVPWLIKLRRNAASRFRKQLEDGVRLTEIISLPEPGGAGNVKVDIPMCDLFGGKQASYGTEELKAHLRSIAEIAGSYENYRAVLTARIPKGALIYAREDRSFVVSRTCLPSSAFICREPRMTAAVWSYLLGVAGPWSRKEEDIARLREYMEKL